MQMFANLFTKGVQNVHHLHMDTCLKTLSSLVNCSVNNVVLEMGP